VEAVLMADREVLTPGERGTGDLGETAGPVPGTMSRATVFWYSAFGLVLFTWFLFGWLVLEQGFIDSVGESLGTAFAVLLAISIIGTVRRGRR
jgi:hypothetical protein